MKKIHFIATFLFAAVLGLSFTACSDDDADESNYNIAPNAGAAVAKTYTGTWTRTLDKDVVTSTGTITFEGTEESHRVKINIAANTDVNLDASELFANIAQQNDTRFAVTKPSSSSDFETTTGFRAYIDNGALTIDFIKSVKVGRKNNEYVYHFEGN